MRAVLIAHSRSSHRTDLVCWFVHLANSEKETRSLSRTQRKGKLAGLLVVAIFVALLLPAFALAQQTSPSDAQYSNNLSQVSTGGGNDPGGSSGGGGLDGNVGPLPFTGFDVIAMTAVALAVTGLGLALQRAVSRDTGDEIS
jgi:hypothetical protein